MNNIYPEKKMKGFNLLLYTLTNESVSKC